MQPSPPLGWGVDVLAGETAAGAVGVAAGAGGVAAGEGVGGAAVGTDGGLGVGVLGTEVGVATGAGGVAAGVGVGIGPEGVGVGVGTASEGVAAGTGVAAGLMLIVPITGVTAITWADVSPASTSVNVSDVDWPEAPMRLNVMSAIANTLTLAAWAPATIMLTKP